MKHTKYGYSALAAAVALAFGVANAQDGIDRESGVDAPPRIETQDDRLGQDRERDINDLERSAEQRTEQAADELESSLEERESDSQSAGIDLGGSADEGERVSAEGGDAGQLDQLTEEHEDLGKFVEAVK